MKNTLHRTKLFYVSGQGRFDTHCNGHLSCSQRTCHVGWDLVLAMANTIEMHSTNDPLHPISFDDVDLSLSWPVHITKVKPSFRYHFFRYEESLFLVIFPTIRGIRI